MTKAEIIERLEEIIAECKAEILLEEEEKKMEEEKKKKESLESMVQKVIERDRRIKENYVG